MLIWDLPKNDTETISLLQNQGLLLIEKQCDNVHKRLYFSKEYSFWKCTKCVSKAKAFTWEPSLTIIGCHLSPH